MLTKEQIIIVLSALYEAKNNSRTCINEQEIDNTIDYFENPCNFCNQSDHDCNHYKLYEDCGKLDKTD
jgi:hypothetical protein